MIVYDGVSIDSVAHVMIEDIKVSPISYNPVVRPRAVRFGSEFVRMGGGTRTVVITFALLEKNKVLRQEYLNNLSVWAKTDAEYILELPQDPLRHLKCVCTGKPEPSTRAWWENKLKYTFTCYDNPYWTSKHEKTVPSGQAFFVMGNAIPLMRIEHQVIGNATARMYSNGEQTMIFSSVPVGGMVIDLNKQTATVNGVSIMRYYQPSGSFIVPKLGKQRITGGGFVKYQERWE